MNPSPAAGLESTPEGMTHASDSSFSYSFLFLPKQKREAMNCIYAFCRLADDVADETRSMEEARDRLAFWFKEIESCYGGSPNHRVTQKLQVVVKQYKIPKEYFLELLRGVEMDFTISRYRTFEDLYPYCYRVASVVGLMCIEIFGYQNPVVKEHAIYQGLAFQLTNILRDVKADADLGRIYIPQEDLHRFQYSERDLLRRAYTPSFRNLMQFEADRAKSFYRKAKESIPKEDRPNLIASEIMGAIYRHQLLHLEKNDFNVFQKPTRLSAFRKMAIALWTWGRIKIQTARF